MSVLGPSESGAAVIRGGQVSAWTGVLGSRGHTPSGGFAGSDGPSVTRLPRDRQAVFQSGRAVFIFEFKFTDASCFQWRMISKGEGWGGEAGRGGSCSRGGDCSDR